MTRGRKRRPGHSPRQRAWVQSAAGRAAAKAASEASRVARLRKPRCGARRKSGGLCRHLALANGRCRLHGGLVPAGSGWLVVQYPDPLLQPEKYAKKVREIERRRQKQAARVAAMTPEQRARYERWHTTHRPGSASRREHARREREAAAILKAPRSDPGADPVAEALEAELAAVQAEKARLTTIVNEDTE